MKSFKQKVIDKGYSFYGDETLIPRYKKSSKKIELLTIGKYISDNDLEKEYESRGLTPAHPLDILGVWNEKDYLGTHWKDKDGKWCFAAFGLWGGERWVNVYRNGDYDWHDDWFFAGVRNSSTLSSEPKTLDTQSFDLRLKKVEKFIESLKNL